MDTPFHRVIEEINKVKAENSYARVVDRIEVFRKEFGDTYGIVTEILKLGQAHGEAVVVKASVVVLSTGAVIATGHAEEIRDRDHIVNATSALENAETSAVGRALAAMGITGGHYASQDEINAVRRKETAISDNMPPIASAPKVPFIKKATKAAETSEEAFAEDLTVETVKLDDPDVAKKVSAMVPLEIPTSDNMWNDALDIIEDVLSKLEGKERQDMFIELHRVNLEFFNKLRDIDKDVYGDILTAYSGDNDEQ